MNTRLGRVKEQLPPGASPKAVTACAAQPKYGYRLTLVHTDAAAVILEHTHTHGTSKLDEAPGTCVFYE